MPPPTQATVERRPSRSWRGRGAGGALRAFSTHSSPHCAHTRAGEAQWVRSAEAAFGAAGFIIKFSADSQLETLSHSRKAPPPLINWAEHRACWRPVSRGLSLSERRAQGGNGRRGTASPLWGMAKMEIELPKPLETDRAADEHKLFCGEVVAEGSIPGFVRLLTTPPFMLFMQ